MTVAATRSTANWTQYRRETVQKIGSTSPTDTLTLEGFAQQQSASVERPLSQVSDISDVFLILALHTRLPQRREESAFVTFLADETISLRPTPVAPVPFSDEHTFITYGEPRTKSPVDALASNQSLAIAKAVVDRLNDLQRNYREEEGEGEGLSVDSLNHFIDFLYLEQKTRLPVLAVTPNAHLLAYWASSDKRRQFTAVFLPNGQVRYAAFSPDPSDGRSTARTSGLVLVSGMRVVATRADCESLVFS